MTADVLEWSFNPWRDRPGRAAIGLGATLLACVALTSLGLAPLLTLVLCVAVVGALAAAFVPVRCRLDGEGATRRNGWVAERRRWGELRRAVRTSDGILLSPSRRGHWLEAYRALFLPLPNRAGRPPDGEVERFLASHGL